MQNAQVYLQRIHFTKLSQFVIPEDPQTQNRIEQITKSFISKGYSADDAYKLAFKQLTGSVSKQSVLLSYMEIFTVIGYGLVILVVFLLVNRHLKQSFDIFKNRVWGS